MLRSGRSYKADFDTTGAERISEEESGVVVVSKCPWQKMQG